MTPRYRPFLQRLALVAATAFVVAQPAEAVEVQRVVSPGGIEAWLVEDHSNPMISPSATAAASSIPRAGKASPTWSPA